jgi:single-stranded DNA-binding protein
MNKVLLVGRLAANPENSTFGPENKKRSRFTVAVKDG